MATPFIMLILMTGPYVMVRAMSLVTHRDYNFRGAAAFGLSIVFIFTAVGHFIKTDAMIQMLPPWVPERMVLVYSTGVLEFAVAIGFLVPTTRKFAGWGAAVMLALFLPLNIYSAMNRIPIGGHAWGPVYLLVRVPLQAIMLWWVCWFTIRKPITARR